MIRQLVDRLIYTIPESTHLSGLIPHSKLMWDSPPDDTIILIKISVKSQLLAYQDHICAYCGLDLGGTSEGQIEHIAPKARYPQFTFEIENLVMACHYCNGFSKKGNHNTIQTRHAIYNTCVFKLVHPYFDDPSLHYDWVVNNKKVIIKGISNKGEYSIRIFKLAEPKITELRAKKVIADIVISNATTPQIDDNLILDAVKYKP